MSITDRFEERDLGCMECGGYKTDDVNDLLAHARAPDCELAKLLGGGE